ncbi:MAG: hypothetical protein NTY07_16135 [Bacteroidia bacterium]|nr:hypothetical protein [Bacteroidia bacterium]
MKILSKIFEHRVIMDKPPVLIDIGASGQLLENFKSFAKYSICLAFDADSRDMQFVEKESSCYKKLVVYNCIVTDTRKSQIDFYLTDSPYCSSTLCPDSQHLSNWNFWKLFEIKKKILLNARNLNEVLNEQSITYIDWFKTDSQGTDLRLFKNLDENIVNKIIVADFEPGFIDAYLTEDKLHSILAHMDKLPFWLSDCNVKGSQRLNKDLKQFYLKQNQKIDLKQSPGWAEISYFNNFKNCDFHGKRELLLGCAFAIIKKQFGFALELAEIGKHKFNDAIFSTIFDFALNEVFINDNIYKIQSLKNRIKHKVIRIIENL